MCATSSSLFKRLLVPIDGAELTPRAIDASVALAAQLGAAITGFIAQAPVPLPTSTAMSVEESRAAETAERLLQGFAARAQRLGVAFEGHYRHTPDIAAAIVQAAQQYECDMIVMLTHGRGAVGRLVFGSHTQQVLARSTIPVLVMH